MTIWMHNRFGFIFLKINKRYISVFNGLLIELNQDDFRTWKVKKYVTYIGKL